MEINQNNKPVTVTFSDGTVKQVIYDSIEFLEGGNVSLRGHLYGKNREGKVALCETCAYDGYCQDKIRYYRCRNYIKIRDDYDKNEKNVAGDRNDGCGSK